MTRRHLLTRCVGCAFLVVLAACANRPASSAQVRASNASTPEAIFPAGTFGTGDGTWKLVFKGDGTFTFSMADQGSASGTYSVHGNEITWETTDYCDQNNLGKATYTWAYANETLVFQVEGEDPCFYRGEKLQNIPYHKK